MSDCVMGLASPGAFPCPERSPTYNLQFSKRAGDGHLVVFGTERGMLVIVDTRAEAVVQRDHNGPVGWGQTDRSSDRFSDRAAKRLVASAGVKQGYCRSWGVRQPAVVAQYRALVNCIFDVEWLHDDGRIALACGDPNIRVHDTETSVEVRRYRTRPHTNYEEVPGGFRIATKKNLRVCRKIHAKSKESSE